MSQNLDIDQDKIVHEEQYKMNLDLEIPETNPVIASTKIITEEKQEKKEIFSPSIKENKPKQIEVKYNIKILGD
jgi:hypothetical protein